MDHSTMDHSMMQGMSTQFDYTLALMAGLLGSGHCLGMCGALVSGYFVKAPRSRFNLNYMCYQVARISIYTLIGAIAATLGVVLVSTGVMGTMQSLLQMAIGVFVIALAMGLLGLAPWQFSLKLLPLSALRKLYAYAQHSHPLIGATLAGTLNGLMPCPLTFAMAVQASSAPTIASGSLLMLAFGLGTLPMMLAVSLLFGKIAGRIRGLMLKVAAFIMLMMGANTLYRGLSFYLDHHFKQHNHFMILKQFVSEWIVFLQHLGNYLHQLMNGL